MNPINLILIHGDATKVLPVIKENSIDLVLTDPPFNVNIDYGIHNDNMTDEEYSRWCFKWISELYRGLKNNHYNIIFTGDKKLFWIMSAIYKTDFIFHHFFKWYKPNGQRGLSGTVFFNRTELAFILSKEKPDINLINRKDVYSDTLIFNNTSNKDKDAVNHDCRRPVPLYKQIIKGFTKENDLVLDPFIGSGTTMKASLELNRNCIGIEMNAEYIDIIKQRLNWGSSLNPNINFHFFTEQEVINNPNLINNIIK